MLMMDEREASVYYLRHLQVRVFGQWVAVTTDSVRQAALSQSSAELHHTTRLQHSALCHLLHHRQGRQTQDRDYRLACTWYCVWRLSRGWGRWRQWQQGRSSHSYSAAYQRAKRYHRKQLLQRGWKMLFGKWKKFRHFVRRRAAMLKASNAVAQQPLSSATAIVPPNAIHSKADPDQSAYHEESSVISVDSLLVLGRKRPPGPPPASLLPSLTTAQQNNVVVSQPSTIRQDEGISGNKMLQLKQQEKYHSHMRHQCLVFLQRLSFLRLFQTQEQQHHLLSKKLLQRRQRRRILRRLIDFQERQEHLRILYRLCSEHYLHQTFHHFRSRLQRQEQNRLETLEESQDLARWHEKKQHRRVLFTLKENAIQRSFDRKRCERCYEHIALPQIQRSLLHRWRTTVTMKKQEQDVVTMYVRKVGTFRRMYEYVHIWKRYLQDFR